MNQNSVVFIDCFIRKSFILQKVIVDHNSSTMNVKLGQQKFDNVMQMVWLRNSNNTLPPTMYKFEVRHEVRLT